MNIYTYAGEEPETPITVSIIASGTVSHSPKLWKISPASARSASVAFWLAQSALIASPTNAGVFGMARTSLISLANADSIFSMVCPAAMDMMSASGRTWSLISVMISANRWGFTARKRMSAWLAAARLSVVVKIPKRSFKDAAVFSVFDVAISRSFVAIPAFKIPPMMALAMFPPPINAIVLFMFLSPPF